MSRNRTLFRVGAIALLLVSSYQTPARANVSTVAGEGSFGVHDGAATAAQFAMPVGIAVDARGTLYVADAGAQRIRLVRDGVVTTLAGSGSLDAATHRVAGGYRDGAASEARFDLPLGVAVAKDGAVYVADAGNRCIRKVQGGEVSTFAGAPQAAGRADGRGNAARFALPRALSFDADGNLYVADSGYGVRRIAPDGTVATLATPGVPASVTGVGAWGTARDGYLFLATAEGLYGVKLPAGGVTFFGKTNEGDQPLGSPYAVVALSAHEAVFSDVVTHTVRYFYFRERTGPLARTFSMPLNGGPPREDAAFVGGGFRDGADETARFFAPMSVAALADGRIAVADAGNRRIRIISAVDRRQPVSDDLSSLQSPPGSFRIAYVSNSFAFHDVTWPESVPGIVEATLNADAGRIGLTKPVKLLAVRLAPSTMTGSSTYIHEFLDSGTVDMVVWALNGPYLGTEMESHPDLKSVDAVAHPERWQGLVTSILRKTYEDLKSQHVQFLALYHPLSDVYGALENAWTFEAAPGADLAYFLKERALYVAAIQQCGAPFFDATPAFDAGIAAARRSPLFGTTDGHFSMRGNALLAEALVRELEREQPWRH